MSVLYCTSKRRTEKSGDKGSDRTITDFYSIALQKTCKLCKVYHVVKSYGDYETTVGGSKYNRPLFAPKSSIQVNVDKDSKLYCYSITESTNTQNVALKPLTERQDYDYVSFTTGKGIGRPKRIGYSHKGFVLLVTWPDETQQVFSDLPEIRDKFKIEGENRFLADYLKTLTICD